MSLFGGIPGMPKVHASSMLGVPMLAEETTFERHYSVDELAAMWGMSDDFVRRLFAQEPGVVVFFKYRPGKRTYRIMRIPGSVAERVHRRVRKA
jgi:hypothetical protein